MCNNENAPDLRMNCEMNQVFCVRVEAFKTCEAVSILENIPEEGITRLPPVKPKAGEAFLYHIMMTNPKMVCWVHVAYVIALSVTIYTSLIWDPFSKNRIGHTPSTICAFKLW